MNQINSKNEINQKVRQQNKKCNHILSCQLQQVYTKKFLKLLRSVLHILPKGVHLHYD